MIAMRLGLLFLSLTATSSAVTPEDFTNALRPVRASSRSSRLQSRQAAGVAGVSQAIVDISNSLAAANNTVVAFDGSLAGLIDVNSGVKDLGDTITTATNTIKSTAQLSAGDS